MIAKTYILAIVVECEIDFVSNKPFCCIFKLYKLVERWGIEPQIPDCRSGVFPLALPPHGFHHCDLLSSTNGISSEVSPASASILNRACNTCRASSFLGNAILLNGAANSVINGIQLKASV